MKKILLSLSLLALAGNSTDCMLQSVANWKTLLFGSCSSFWYWKRSKDLTLIKKIKQGDIEGVNAALANGANINKMRMPYFNPLLATSPLHEAAFSGNINMVKNILAKPDLSQESIAWTHHCVAHVVKINEANKGWKAYNSKKENQNETDPEFEKEKNLSAILTLLEKAKESKTKPAK